MTEAGQWHTAADTPLSDLGVAHAEAAGLALSTWNADFSCIILTSMYLRARQTGDYLGKCLNATITPTKDLYERDLGVWSGLSFEEIERGWPGQLEAWHANELTGPPGGESDKEVADRLTGALLWAIPRQSPQIHLVVSHAGLLRGLVSYNNIPDAKVPPLGGRFLSLDHSENSLRVGPRVEL